MLLPDKLSDEDIIRTLREHHLDYPGGRYLAQLRATLHPPTPFFPMVESDVPSYTFLQQHKVHNLFFRNAHATNALSILEDPRAKELVEALILVEEPLLVICTRLRRFGFNVAPKAIEYFEHFFFNTSLVDSTELRALMSIRVDDMMLDGSSPEDLIRAKAMKQAMYSDARYMAVNSPTPKLAAMKLQLRHGLKPNRADYSALAEGARTISIIAVQEALLRGGPKSATEARDLATVAVNMDNILRAKDDGIVESNKNLALVALTTDLNEIPTVRALSNGNFTESLELPAHTEVDNDK
jgi:hypothetical protein